MACISFFSLVTFWTRGLRPPRCGGEIRSADEGLFRVRWVVDDRHLRRWLGRVRYVHLPVVVVPYTLWGFSKYFPSGSWGGEGEGDQSLIVVNVVQVNESDAGRRRWGMRGGSGGGRREGRREGGK